MSPGTGEARLVEADLRAEIRLLGQLLGDTLREHEGVPLYELEESIRNRTKTLRQRYDAGDEAALVADLDRIPLEDAARLVRAFATYFQLVNLAELERQARSADDDERGEFDRLLLVAWSRTVAPEQVARLLERVEVRPVLTAHPTEAVRRSILDHQDRIGEELSRLRAPLGARDQRPGEAADRHPGRDPLAHRRGPIGASAGARRGGQRPLLPGAHLLRRHPGGAPAARRGARAVTIPLSGSRRRR